MAVKEYRIINGGYIAVTDNTSSTPGAAVLTLQHTGKDQRKALRVVNGGSTGITVVIEAGDGPRAALGSKDVVVAAGAATYIALFDTARFTDLSTGDITIALMDTSNPPQQLGTTALANIQIEAVQL